MGNKRDSTPDVSEDKTDPLSLLGRQTTDHDDQEKQSFRKDKPRITWVLVMTALGISTGSFQYGYNLAVLNEPHQLIWSYMNSTNFDQTGEYLSQRWVLVYWSAIVSVFALGGALGATAAGWWALVFGRKRGCLTNTVIGFLSVAMLVLSPAFKSYHSLIIGRFVLGIHSGIYTMLCPLYLNEISTPPTRGPLGIVHQAGTVLGLLVAQILGFPVILGTASRWIWLLGFAAIPLIMQIAVLSACPESPRYTAKVVKDAEATRKALRCLRGTLHVEEELYELVDEKGAVLHEKSCVEVLLMPEHRLNLGVGIVVMMSPHVAGSIAVAFYSAIIFVAAGATPEEAMYESSGMGAILVVMAGVSIWLVNRAGRRPLLLTGLAVMAASSVVIVVLQYFMLAKPTVVAVMVFTLGFAIGPGPIPFTAVPELFPPDVKRSALSICVAANWLANFGVGFTFPHIHTALGYLTFSVFTVGSLALFIFLYFLLPETRPGPHREMSKSYSADGQCGDHSLSTDLGSSIDVDMDIESSKKPISNRFENGFSSPAVLRALSKPQVGIHRKSALYGNEEHGLVTSENVFDRSSTSKSTARYESDSRNQAELPTSADCLDSESDYDYELTSKSAKMESSNSRLVSLLDSSSRRSAQKELDYSGSPMGVKNRQYVEKEEVSNFYFDDTNVEESENLLGSKGQDHSLGKVNRSGSR